MGVFNFGLNMVAIGDVTGSYLLDLFLLYLILVVSVFSVTYAIITRRRSGARPRLPAQIDSQQSLLAKPMEASVDERIMELERVNQELRARLWRYERRPSQVFAAVLSSLGGIALVFAYLLSSLILTFIGLGLVFWGLLLFYVRPARFVKGEILSPLLLGYLESLDRLVSSQGYKGKPIFLPPRYLKAYRSGMVFIPAEGDSRIPPVEDLARDDVFYDNPRGVLLSSPGFGLMRLYEKELGVDFARIDLDYVASNLPRSLVEGLELAEEAELNLDGNEVTLKISGDLCIAVCEGVNSVAHADGHLGCPFCGSVALAVARASGKAVLIEKHGLVDDGKGIETKFRIVEV